MSHRIPQAHTAENEDATSPLGGLTDSDIQDAMQQIPGYLDISTEDVRSIFLLAHRHALKRLFAEVSADRLMRSSIVPLNPTSTLDVAARHLAESGFKGLPVVDAGYRVLGMLTETDFLRRLKVGSFLDLLLKMIDDGFELTHKCHETTVSAAMTTPAVSVRQEAGFSEILQGFRGHKGRSMPVVDDEGRLVGLLLRKDFISACNLGELS